MNFIVILKPKVQSSIGSIIRTLLEVILGFFFEQINLKCAKLFSNP